MRKKFFLKKGAAKRILSACIIAFMLSSSCNSAFAEVMEDGSQNIDDSTIDSEDSTDEIEYTVYTKNCITGEESERTYLVGDDTGCDTDEAYTPDSYGTYSIIGPDNRFDTSQFSEVYHKVCYITGTAGNSTYSGTGFLIGPNTVATSSHVIYDKNKYGGYLSNVKVSFEEKNQTDSNKIAYATYMHGFAADVNDKNNDWAIIELNKPLGEMFGYFGYTTACNKGASVSMTGFPYDRSMMTTCNGQIDSIENNTLWHNCDSMNGSSGSPLYRSDLCVVGIHKGENGNMNFATKISLPVYQQFHSSKVQYNISEQGYLDSVSTNTIKGWAVNPDAKYNEQRTDFYIYDCNGKLHDSGSCIANEYRSDVGLHGFHFNISWLKYQPGEYKVHVYTIGVWGGNPLLKNSPKSYNVRQSTGTVDYVNASGVGGWVWKPDAPNDSIEAHIYFYDADTGKLLYGKPVSANVYRSDLKNDGRGNGFHGFSLSVNWKQWGAKRIRVDTYAVDGSGYNPQVSSKIYNVQ